jgi:dihydropteroate synthase
MFTLNCKGRLLVADQPLVMGIINSTPDSFYAASRHESLPAILKQAGQMLQDGADIIDVGGQSTRPGSRLLTADEELQRVITCIAGIHKEFPQAIVSIDTFYSKVAVEAVAAGAAIVNDISGAEMDPLMLSVVAALKIPYICMHMKGTPQNMQQNPVYENVVTEVLDYFIEKIDSCKKAGIKDLIIDPGFGFGKTIQHNFQLLKNLSAFKLLGKPIMAGFSRKSTVYKTLNTTAEHALNGSTVLNTLALENGAGILRVHDVKEAKEAVILFEAYNKAG